MFRRILIPTDLTDRTIRAIDVARGVQATNDSQLMLLHVIETISGADFKELSAFYGTARETGVEPAARDRDPRVGPARRG
jgi:nucleotide-binding universal stress UspA family protein